MLGIVALALLVVPERRRERLVALVLATINHSAAEKAFHRLFIKLVPPKGREGGVWDVMSVERKKSFLYPEKNYRIPTNCFM